MPKDPFQIVRQNPGFLEVLRRKPGLVGAVLQQRLLRWCRARQGLHTLTGIEFALTYACQASCSHCSASSLLDSRSERERVNPGELRVVAEEAFALGAYEVNITGGEPTLLQDLEEYVGCFRPERTFIGLNTNGQLIDPARVVRLRDAGVDMLKLSLDSPDPADHDANRGLPGNHAHVRAVLASVRTTRGIRGHICSVGTSEIVRSGGAARLVRIAAELDATIGFTLPVAVGRWSDRYDVMLDDADLAGLKAVCRAPNAFFQGSVGTGEFACPAGRTEIYVSPYGDVLPCPFIQRSFGSVRADPLGVVFERMGVAADLAGGASLCLAGQSQRWMKSHVPSTRSRLEMPSCSTEHQETFCHRPARPEGA